MGSTVLLDVDDGVAVVTLNRPERRNAITLALVRELNDALDTCDRADSVRAIVLTGAGTAFCVGADLAEGSIDHPGGVDEESPQLRSPITISKPVIAALNGDAVGGGITLPLHCDLRLVAEDARVGFVFVRRGVIPELSGHWLLPRLAGIATALDLVLTGRLVTGREAAELGVCHRALPRSDVLGEAIRIGRDIATNVAPASAAAAKRLLWDSLAQPREVTTRREEVMFSWCAGGADAIEGVESFLEKRAPSWSQRSSQADAVWAELVDEAAAPTTTDPGAPKS